jgi:lactate dehydrogenase-like 2-hydroxyacid dehydrogenase
MAKPILLVTRKLPESVEARAARDYDARRNLDDAQGASEQLVRRAREAGASGILCAPGDPFDSASINALPPSVRVIATFSVGF